MDNESQFSLSQRNKDVTNKERGNVRMVEVLFGYRGIGVNSWLLVEIQRNKYRNRCHCYIGVSIYTYISKFVLRGPRAHDNPLAIGTLSAQTLISKQFFNKRNQSSSESD